MKYQIYLNKQTSEILEGLAKAVNKKPATFIKDFIEGCFDLTEETLGEKATNEVRKYGRENKNDKNEI